MEGFVDDFWAKIGKKWLPAFKKDSEQILITWADGISLSEVNLSMEALRKIGAEMWDEEGERACKLLLSLSNDQLIELANKLEESNEWIMDDLKETPEESIDNYKDHLVDRFENFYGSIEDPQEATLIDKFHYSPDALGKRLASKRSAQREFVSAVNSRPTAIKLKAIIAGWIDKPETMREEKYRQRYSEYRLIWRTKFSATDGIATASQRKYAIGKIKSLVTDIEKGFL